jgi:hypothetical protein
MIGSVEGPAALAAIAGGPWYTGLVTQTVVAIQPGSDRWM